MLLGRNLTEVGTWKPALVGLEALVLLLAKSVNNITRDVLDMTTTL